MITLKTMLILKLLHCNKQLNSLHRIKLNGNKNKPQAEVIGLFQSNLIGFFQH